MEDKTKFKNWKNGDVFALKIDNGSKYDGRYILLEAYDGNIWKPTKKRIYFRAKLTKDNNLPQNHIDIETAEYIKITLNRLDNLFFREGKETFNEMMKKIELQNYEFDRYGYVYDYYFELIKFKNVIELKPIYIGNFDYPNKIEHEKIPRFEFDGIPLKQGSELIESLLESYEEFNLKKSNSFSKKTLKENNIIVKKMIEFQKSEIDDLMKKFRNNEIIEPILPEYGWGPKLYDIDLAYEYKEYFKQVYSEEKTMDTMCKELSDIVEEETKYNDERTIFWMVIADNFLKKGIMKQELKDLALKCIRLNLKLWKPHQDYKEREKELNKLKKRLEEYEFKE